MDPPSNGVEVRPTTLEEVLEGGPSFHCDLCDTELVHKIAQTLLPGLASACVDNTLGGLFRNPASVAVDIRKEMIDYLTQRSENFVAESVVLEDGVDTEVTDHPYDVIRDFIEDFSSSKRNIFSRVSGWVMSDSREDKIDDFVQEMEVNGFWLLGRREAVSETLLKNVDFKNEYHCDMKFETSDELEDHVHDCGFRTVECINEGCNSRFSAALNDYHDSVCPFKILPCEQNCSEYIMRQAMDRHCITVCPMKLVNCPFYPSGCLTLIPKSTIDEHRLENLHFHLVCVLKALHKEASVKSLEKRAEDIQMLALESRGRLTTARDARSLTYAIKDFEAKLGPLEVIEEDEDEDVNDEKQDNEKNEESKEVAIKEEKEVEEKHLDLSGQFIEHPKSSFEPEKRDVSIEPTEPSFEPEKRDVSIEPTKPSFEPEKRDVSIEPTEPSFEPEKGDVSSSNDKKEDLKKCGEEEIVKTEESKVIIEEKEFNIAKEKEMLHEQESRIEKEEIPTDKLNSSKPDKPPE